METYDQKQNRLNWMWKRLIIKMLLFLIKASISEEKLNSFKIIDEEAEKYLKESD